MWIFLVSVPGTRVPDGDVRTRFWHCDFDSKFHQRIQNSPFVSQEERTLYYHARNCKSRKNTVNFCKETGIQAEKHSGGDARIGRFYFQFIFIYFFLFIFYLFHFWSIHCWSPSEYHFKCKTINTFCYPGYVDLNIITAIQIIEQSVLDYL